MKLNIADVLNLFKRSQNRATLLLKNKNRAKNTIKNAFGKAITNKKNLEGVWSKLILLFAVAKDYVNGDYTEIPKRSIVAIVGGLIYFLSPIDVIPDFVPVLGYIDDIFVLNLVYKQVIKDLDKYKIWKDEQIKLSNNVNGFAKS